MLVFWFDPLKNQYIVNDYNINKYGLRTVNKTCFIYNNTITVNSSQIVNSLQDILNQLSGTKKPIIYNGININKHQDDIFIYYYNGEYYV